jgi:hypothetical protein
LIAKRIVISSREIAVFGDADDPVSGEPTTLEFDRVEDDDVSRLNIVRHTGRDGNESVAGFECRRHAARRDVSEQNRLTGELSDDESDDDDDREDSKKICRGPP